MSGLSTHPKNYRDESVQCYKMRISYTGNGKGDGNISIKHIDADGKIMSECVFSPDEAYEYAHAVLQAFDAVTEP